jgi:hypothetical protein
MHGDSGPAETALAGWVGYINRHRVPESRVDEANPACEAKAARDDSFTGNFMTSLHSAADGFE